MPAGTSRWQKTHEHEFFGDRFDNHDAVQEKCDGIHLSVRQPYPGQEKRREVKACPSARSGQNRTPFPEIIIRSSADKNPELLEGDALRRLTVESFSIGFQR